MIFCPQWWNNGTFRIGLFQGRISIGRQQPFTRDFSNTVCTGYSSLAHAQSNSFREPINAAFQDVQITGEFFGGFCIRLSENEHCLHLDGGGSTKKRGGHTPSPGASKYEVEVVPAATLRL